MAGRVDVSELRELEIKVLEVVGKHDFVEEMEDDFKTIRILLVMLSKQQMSSVNVQWIFAHLAEHLAEATDLISDEVASINAWAELDDYMVDLENKILSRAEITDPTLLSFFLRYFAEAEQTEPPEAQKFEGPEEPEDTKERDPGEEDDKDAD